MHHVDNQRPVEEFYHSKLMAKNQVPHAYLDASSLPRYCWTARINDRRRENVLGRGGAPITALVFIPHELVLCSL
eukprot:6311956-Lingulodinium_polyedra.AAC.1